AWVRRLEIQLIVCGRRSVVQGYSSSSAVATSSSRDTGYRLKTTVHRPRTSVHLLRTAVRRPGIRLVVCGRWSVVAGRRCVVAGRNLVVRSTAPKEQDLNSPGCKPRERRPPTSSSPEGPATVRGAEDDVNQDLHERSGHGVRSPH